MSTKEITITVQPTPLFRRAAFLVSVFSLGAFVFVVFETQWLWGLIPILIIGLLIFRAYSRYRKQMAFTGEIIDFKMEGEALSIRSEWLTISPPTPFDSLMIRTTGNRHSFYQKSTQECLGTFHRRQIGRIAFNRLKGMLWNRAVREPAWWEVIVEGLVDLG